MAQSAPASRTKRSPRSTKAGSSGASGPLPTLRILETRVLRGPNYWAREPVIRMLVDLGVLEEYPSNKLPNFTDALVALIPTLEDHACSLGRRGGFITRLREGTWVGHIAEHVALEFQNLAGTDVRHGKTRSAGTTGHYNCIFEYREEVVGLEAGIMAVGLVNHLVAPDDPEVFFDFAPKLEALIRMAERTAFGPSTQALIDEAVSRDIPFIRLLSDAVRAMLEAESVAVVGASPRPGSLGERMVGEVLRSPGFRKVWLVNPGYPEVAGRAAPTRARPWTSPPT